MLNLILGEGKNDAWFFDEVIRNNAHREPYMLHDTEKKRTNDLISAIKNWRFMQNRYSLIIYGDSGKLKTYKILQRVIVDTLGKFNDDILITFVLDDDGSKYSEIQKGLIDRLEELANNPCKFSPFPKTECNNGLYYMTHPKGKGRVIVRLCTVPISLETCIVNELKKSMSCIQDDPHKVIKDVSRDKYNDDPEKLIRCIANLLKDEEWAKKVVSFAYQ